MHQYNYLEIQQDIFVALSVTHLLLLPRTVRVYWVCLASLACFLAHHVIVADPSPAWSRETNHVTVT